MIPAPARVLHLRGGSRGWRRAMRAALACAMASTFALAAAAQSTPPDSSAAADSTWADSSAVTPTAPDSVAAPASPTSDSVTPAAAAPRDTSRVVRDPGCGTFRIVLDPTTVVYTLPRGFLRPGAERVTRQGVAWQRDSDYTLDPLRGELRVLRTPLAGDTLSIETCWLLKPPAYTVQRIPYRAPRQAGIDSAATDTVKAPAFATRPATARDPEQSPGGTSLTLSGNKSVAVDFGSQQDAALRQSLDLALSGTLAPGVELTGVLSDRNTPLTTGGSTQNLESLDRVLIELKAPQGAAALGDVPLVWNQGQFGRLERRLQGARGDWRVGGFQAQAAAATQQGEFRRMQFFGEEGRQGPYLLEGPNGALGVPVVAGSDVVTVDGVRLVRGEAADYSIDYERGRITFTNRRPIGGESRIAIDYQVAAARYRRNLAAAGGQWDRSALRLWTQVITEGDDRGRPLDAVLTTDDRVALAQAGDSIVAFGGGVSGGGGDYDTVHVGLDRIFAFAGPDSGEFQVRFANVGTGKGDYAESTLVDGRGAYRFVGAGRGSHIVGRLLPLAETHRLWTAGVETRRGGFSVSAEGAASSFDRNTFSSFDDQDNNGGAGTARMALEIPTGGTLAGKVGALVEARVVDERFQPFTPLERPFAEESWGLPVGADLEHQRRATAGVYFQPRSGGELRANVGRLALPSGFESWRREVTWAREGLFITHGTVERSDGTQKGLAFESGGRRRAVGDVGLAGRWLAPSVRLGYDERTSPSDTGRVGARVREAGAELATGRAVPWRASASWSVRRDASATMSGFADVAEARSARVALDSPADRKIAVALQLQRRDFDPTDPLISKTRSDLGSVRVRAEGKGGLRGTGAMEITSEGESRRSRDLVFVGAGQGAYDALGNFVGIGDYDLVVTVIPGFDRIGRAATSAQLTVPVGRSEFWRGSRVEVTFESDARRRGELLAGDPLISPRAVREDNTLARGSVLQRGLVELFPTATFAALMVRIEHRTTADRSFTNFGQVQDEKTATARWRTRLTPAWSTEIELRARRREVSQALAGGGSFERQLEDDGGTFQSAFTPSSALRAAAVVEASWSRPEGAAERSRLLRVGPDVGIALGPRGRLETSFRRAFVAGPRVLDLLPTADPLADQQWEGNARVDFRVYESITFGTSATIRDRVGRPVQTTGRAELRAFF